MPMARIFRWQRLNRIAQLTNGVLSADMRPPRKKSGFDPEGEVV